MALCPVLVQRDDQLAVLESALMSAHGGEGGLAVLSGEAGIGKTRLEGLRRVPGGVQNQCTECRSMIRAKSTPAGSVPKARPESPSRREAQKASATAGSP